MNIATTTTARTLALMTLLLAVTAGNAFAKDRDHEEDNRATHALNVLEDQGYGQPLAPDLRVVHPGFTNFRLDQDAFAATTGNGRQVHIQPEEGVVIGM